MKKTKIVFAVIFTASVGLAIVAACLGSPIQSLLISVLSVLYLVCFILSVIEDHLSKIVSMLGVAQRNNVMADGELWAQELDRLRQEWDKPELELRNGKFYRGDVEVLPEIGNWERINLLRRLEKEKNK